MSLPIEQLEARRVLSVSTHLFPIVKSTGVSQPASVVSGPDGNLWFTETFGSKIGRMTTKGTSTLFSATAGNANDITVGPDKNLWFTLGSDSKIGRMTTSGSVKLFTVPGSFNDPTSITKGPDGKSLVHRMGLQQDRPYLAVWND